MEARPFRNEDRESNALQAAGPSDRDRVRRRLGSFAVDCASAYPVARRPSWLALPAEPSLPLSNARTREAIRPVRIRAMALLAAIAARCRADRSDARKRLLRPSNLRLPATAAIRPGSRDAAGEQHPRLDDASLYRRALWRAVVGAARALAAGAGYGARGKPCGAGAGARDVALRVRAARTARSGGHSRDLRH